MLMFVLNKMAGCEFSKHFSKLHFFSLVFTSYKPLSTGYRHWPPEIQLDCLCHWISTFVKQESTVNDFKSSNLLFCLNRKMLGIEPENFKWASKMLLVHKIPMWEISVVSYIVSSPAVNPDEDNILLSF